MKRRLLALLLCFAMVFPILPVNAVENFEVQMDGEAVSSVSLPQYEKVELTAEGDETSAYQWQIHVSGDIWVDITGANSSTIELSYAMVANLLDDGVATVRCVAARNGETVVTDAVAVTIDMDAVPEFDTPEFVRPEASNEAQAVGDAVVSTPDESEEDEEDDVDYEAAIAEAEAALEDASDEWDAAEADLKAAEAKAAEAEEKAEAAGKASTEAALAAVLAAEAAEAEDATEEDVEAAEQAASDAAAAKEEADAARSAADEAAAAVAIAEERVAAAETAYFAADEELTNLMLASGNMPAVASFGLTNEPDTADAEDENTTHSIIINYVFADGKQAANPWTATIAAGSDYTQSVTSPTVVGYTPDPATINVDVTEIAEDKVYTVTYRPALVSYTVKHYQQNLNDDKYTLVDEVTETGYTESKIGADLEKSYEGFYALLYDKDTLIAADSSTVVEIYYDRYYFLMTFDLDGGYGVEPIYARYGAPVEAGTPTKAGYVFGGWNPAFTYTTMPAENTEFKAIWTSGNTTYDVVFWYENADDNGFSQAGVLYDQTAAAGSVVNGSSFANSNFTGRDSEHFTYSHADENVTVKGDGSTVVNVYFSRNAYTLTFSMGSWANSCSVEEHRHVDACRNLICSKEEHSHDGCESVLTCDKPVHAHSSSCCTLTEHNHDFVCYITGCSMSEHSHGDGNCTCSVEAHSHSTSCYTYSCGKIEHTHSGVDGSCYVLSCGKNEHYHSGNTCYLIVTAKYDADITAVWEANPVKGVIDAGYLFQSSVTNKYYYFLEKMPGQNITMTKASLAGNNKYTWYYYLEVLPGQDTTGLTTRTSGNKTYYLYHSGSVTGSDVSLTYEEDYFPITGFTQRDGKVPSFSNGTAYLYYTRNSYTLTFSNNGDVVEDHGGTYLYEADISGTNFTPEYPADLEPNAYVFEGWYESPFYGDTKFNFTTTDEDGNTVKATMPAKDLTLYARWVPVEHNVRLFPTSVDMENETNQIGETEVVDHGTTATKPADPTRGEYTFVGWFYMDGETEKAFDFSMPVNQDLDLYAKWSSNVLMEYTIHYELEDGTVIAPETTGSALAGSTKTFEAKAGEELNEGYQSGYFPQTNSHSLTIDIEDPSKNEFTFVYVPKDEVPYVVKYLEVGTEKVLKEDKAAVTRDAVVTEKFEPITGYMPDAYQKRLVLSANEEENVIIFWYAVDSVHAPVQIIHYIQNAVGDGYTMYQESTDLNGVIGDEYSANILTISGYTYDHATANAVAVEAAGGKVTGTVATNGLILELYYNRNLYPYEFKFLEQGTNNVLAESVTGTARFGAQVTQTAKTIPGYILVSDAAQDMIIAKEDGETAVNNVRIFYYTEQDVVINYVPVGPDGVYDGSGTVTPVTETVKAVSGTATGSVAAPSDAYKFVGWFEDVACTDPVDAEDGTVVAATNQFVPAKVNGVYVEDTFYAKFEYNLTSMTIAKSGSSTLYDAGDTFIFDIYDGDDLLVTVSMKAGESVKINNVVVGDTYIVKERAQTSRYNTVADQALTVQVDAAKNTVTFTNTLRTNKWLSDTDSQTNVFNK